MYLLSIEQHSVDPLDGVVGSLLGLEVDEAVPLGVGVGRILLKDKSDINYFPFGFTITSLEVIISSATEFETLPEELIASRSL